MEEQKGPLAEKMGTQEYINRDCWLATTLGYPPAKRCWYCELRFKSCPFTQYLIVSSIMSVLYLGLVFIFGKKVTQADILIVCAMMLVYGYSSTKSAERIIEANFAEKKARFALEKNNAVLEMKIEERTRELKGLTGRLEQQIQDRTKELQEKVDELEKINRLAVGRELKMVELKEKIKGLEEETKRK